MHTHTRTHVKFTKLTSSQRDKKHSKVTTPLAVNVSHHISSSQKASCKYMRVYTMYTYTLSFGIIIILLACPHTPRRFMQETNVREHLYLKNPLRWRDHEDNDYYCYYYHHQFRKDQRNGRKQRSTSHLHKYVGRSRLHFLPCHQLERDEVRVKTRKRNKVHLVPRTKCSKVMYSLSRIRPTLKFSTLAEAWPYIFNNTFKK